jgi:hypothetical protein
MNTHTADVTWHRGFPGRRHFRRQAALIFGQL